MSTNDKGHSVEQSQGDSQKVTLRLKTFLIKPNRIMKQYAKVQSKVLTTALNEEHIKDFGVLAMYLQWFDKDEDCLISDIREFDGKLTTGLKLSLEDYFFNERESKGLWELAEKLLGKKTIDMKILKIVSL